MTSSSTARVQTLSVSQQQKSSETHSCEKTALGVVLRSQGQSNAALALIRRAGSSSNILSSKSNAGGGNL